MKSPELNFQVQGTEHYYLQMLGARHEADLRARYAEPQRHYHTWRHLQEMLLLMEQLDEELLNPGAVALALFYHDAVYEPGASDNEARSAKLMKRTWGSGGESRALSWCIEAERMILATKRHQLPNDGRSNHDCGLFLDMDMAVLGFGRARYAEYSRQIRAENARYSSSEYAEGRARFLYGLLDQPEPIYNTRRFQVSFEGQAKLNLAWEIEALRSGEIQL